VTHQWGDEHTRAQRRADKVRAPTCTRSIHTQPSQLSEWLELP
jgi:hypothetical protein